MQDSTALLELGLMKLTYLIPIFCLLFQIKSFAQSEGWISDHEMSSFNNLSYNKPSGFGEIMGDDCFEDNSKLKEIIYCGGNQLHSIDDKVIVFIMFSSLYTLQPNDRPVVIVPPSRKANEFSSDRYYLWYIKQDIIKALGNERENQWEDQIDYYSDKKTKRKFNADLAFKYTLPLETTDYYKGEYNNLKVLFMAKDKAFLRIYYLYKNMPKKELAKYEREIEGIFMYKQ